MPGNDTEGKRYRSSVLVGDSENRSPAQACNGEGQAREKTRRATLSGKRVVSDLETAPVSNFYLWMDTGWCPSGNVLNSFPLDGGGLEPAPYSMWGWG